MAGFPCHGLRALSTVLASADTHAALEKKAGSLMVSLTGRRDAKRLQAIVANLYVRDGVVYARSDVQVHEQLVVPKEVSLFVVCMAALSITVNTLKKTTRTKHNALFSSQAVVQLLAKHGFYAGVAMAEMALLEAVVFSPPPGGPLHNGALGRRGTTGR